MRSKWQVEQGRRCGCGGSNEMCGCQNVSPHDKAAKGALMVTDDQIEHMVARFLTWPLPDDFCPDAGITFNPTYNGGQSRHVPVGTNLLTYDQAKAMVQHLVSDHLGDDI